MGRNIATLSVVSVNSIASDRTATVVFRLLPSDHKAISDRSFIDSPRLRHILRHSACVESESQTRLRLAIKIKCDYPESILGARQEAIMSELSVSGLVLTIENSHEIS